MRRVEIGSHLIARVDWRACVRACADPQLSASARTGLQLALFALHAAFIVAFLRGFCLKLCRRVRSARARARLQGKGQGAGQGQGHGQGPDGDSAGLLGAVDDSSSSTSRTASAASSLHGVVWPAAGGDGGSQSGDAYGDGDEEDEGTGSSLRGMDSRTASEATPAVDSSSGNGSGGAASVSILAGPGAAVHETAAMRVDRLSRSLPRASPAVPSMLLGQSPRNGAAVASPAGLKQPLLDGDV